MRLLRSGQGRTKAKFDRGFALLNQVCPLQWCNSPCMRGNRMRCIAELTLPSVFIVGMGPFRQRSLRAACCEW